MALNILLKWQWYLSAEETSAEANDPLLHWWQPSWKQQQPPLLSVWLDGRQTKLTSQNSLAWRAPRRAPCSNPCHGQDCQPLHPSITESPQTLSVAAMEGFRGGSSHPSMVLLFPLLFPFPSPPSAALCRLPAAGLGHRQSARPFHSLLRLIFQV